MSNLPAFYTQAGNFRNEVEGSVDPRTGMFNVTLKLGEVVGNNNLGPSFPVILTYNPLATLNGPTTTVFGEGVSLGMTLYDASSAPGRLSLSTGEQYIVDPNTGKLHQNKLDRVKFEVNPDNYTVTYRSGNVEILRGQHEKFSLKPPKQLMDPTGHSLYLNWNTDHLIPMLESIVDDTKAKLLSVDYSKNDRPLIKFFPGQPEEYDVQLELSDNYLQTITNLSLGENKSLVWVLHYDRVGENGYWGTWVTGITTPGRPPNAKTEYVSYNGGDGHSGAGFPDSSIPRLPQVHVYTRDPGCHQPPIVSAYEYVGGSFLGANTGGSGKGLSDVLYGDFDGYTYGSNETQTCNGRTVKTSRTYNRYHLLTDEVVSQNGCVHTIHTEYGALKRGYGFDDQPANCQCPTKKTMKWTSGGSEAQQSVVTVYDDQGNLTESTPYHGNEQCGPQKTWEYYKGDGSDPGCPQDPLGFVNRFVKNVKTIPYSTSYANVPTLTTTYTYNDILPEK